MEESRQRVDVTVQLTGVEVRSEAGHIGTVTEQVSESGGGRFDTTTPTQVRSIAESDSSGMSTRLEGKPDDSYRRERRVEGCVSAWLRRLGRAVTVLPIQPGCNDHDETGADGIITVDGLQLALQVVSLPIDQAFWRAAGQGGPGEVEGTWDAWVTRATEAIAKKLAKYPNAVRYRMLLALDGEHVGPLLLASDAIEKIRRNYAASAGDGRFWAVVIAGPAENSLAVVSEPADSAPSAR